MLFSIANRALFLGVLAGAVIIAGMSACSRSDRTETGRADTAAVMQETTDTTALPRSDTAGYRGMERDTSTAPRTPTTRDTATAPAEPPDTARAVRDTSETSAAPLDTTSTVETAEAAPTDTTTEDVSADTAVAGYAEMARDTSTAPEQVEAIAPADTVAQAEGDVALQARVDTARVEADVDVEADVAPVAEADSGAIHAQVDTTAEVPTEVAVETGPRAKEDTVSIKADSLAQYHEADRVRPPEDSTETLGNVTGDENADEVDAAREDRETVAAAGAPSDEVGAAAIGGNVTGPEAVSLMTRQGARCIVVDPESDKAIRWDMASTPATLNPCGMGSMNLSRIWTELAAGKAVSR